MSDGIPSPNSDFQQQIKNVTGNANEKIQNKNLFDGALELGIYSGSTGQKVSNDEYVRSSNFIEVNELTNYKFSNDGVGISLDIYEYKEDYSYNLTGTKLVNSTSHLTTESGTKYITFRTYAKTTDTNMKIQLEQGTTATDFVPHEEQNLPFTFAEGQRAMQGTELKDDGINNIRTQLIIDGTENITLSTATVGTSNYGKFDVTISKRADVNDRTALCSHLKYKFQGWATAGNENTFSFTVPTILRLLLDINEFPTVEALKTYLANNNMTFEFVTEQPEIIPYNSTQQAQYNAIKEARSYNDQINISSTSDELGFDMSVEALEQSVKQVLGGNY